MPRIRTIKPDFFRHEGLQYLESQNPQSFCMLVFPGIWTLCDKQGVFEWRPKLMKLDILPFLTFEMETTLSILEKNGFISKFEINGKTYGHVPNFKAHQRITGKEAQDPPKYPSPPTFPVVVSPMLPGCVPNVAGREGKGREMEGNGVVGAGVSRECPEDLLAIWQEFVPVSRRNGLSGFVMTRNLSDQWRKHAACRLREAELAWHRKAIERLTRSVWACGGKPPSEGHSKPFRASFDWYVSSESNCIKAYEGRYDD